MVDQEIRVLGDENIIANPKNSQKQYPLTFKAVPNVIVYGRKKTDLNFTVPITEGTNFNFNLERTAIIFSDSFNLEEYSYIMVKNPFEEISDFFYVSSLEELDPTGKEFNEFNDEVVKWLRRLVNIISNRCMIFETTLFKDLNNFPNIKSGQTFIRTEDGWTGITIRDINSELDLIFNKYVEEINKKIQEHQTQMNELLEQWKQDIQKYAENVKQYEIVRVVTQTGHGFVFEPVMYSISQRKFVKAVFPHGADGVAVRVDDNNFRLVWAGRVEIPATAKDTQQRDFVLGEYYFLGEGSNGGIQREKPDTYYQHLFQVMYSDKLRQNIADVLLSVPINQKGKRWDVGEAKTTVNDIEELKMSDFPVGKVVEVLGYYKAGDGADHKRIISTTDDGSGVQLSNKLFANLITEGNTYDITHLGFRAINTASDYLKGNTYDCSVVFNQLRTKGIFVSNKRRNFFFPNKTFYFSEPFFTIIDNLKGDNAKLFFPESDGLSWVIKDKHYFEAGFTVDGFEIESNGNCLAFKEEENTGNNNIYHSIFKNLRLKSLNKNCIFGGNARNFNNRDVLCFGNYFENIHLGAPNGYGFVGIQSGYGLANKFFNITDLMGQCKAIFYNACGKISKVNTSFNASIDFIKIDNNSTPNYDMFFDLEDCNAEGFKGYFLTNTSDSVKVNLTMKNCSFHPIDNNGIKRDKSPINSALNFSALNGELKLSNDVKLYFEENVAKYPYQVTAEYPNDKILYNQVGTILCREGYLIQNNIIGIDNTGAVETDYLKNNIPIYKNIIANYITGCVQPSIKKLSLTTGELFLDNYYNTINIEQSSSPINHVVIKDLKKGLFLYAIKNISQGNITISSAEWPTGFILLNNSRERILKPNEISFFMCYSGEKSYEILTTATTSQVSQLNTLYHMEKMKEEGVYNDFITYTDEKTAYDKQQRKLSEQRQLAYEQALKENPELTYEEFMSVQPMLLNIVEEPQPSDALKKFMDKYL